MIIFNQGTLLLGSNHFLIYFIYHYCCYAKILCFLMSVNSHVLQQKYCSVSTHWRIRKILNSLCHCHNTIKLNFLVSGTGCVYHNVKEIKSLTHSQFCSVTIFWFPVDSCDSCLNTSLCQYPTKVSCCTNVCSFVKMSGNFKIYCGCRGQDNSLIVHYFSSGVTV